MGACRHQDGLDPSPSGPGPFVFVGGLALDRYDGRLSGVGFAGMVDNLFLPVATGIARTGASMSAASNTPVVPSKIALTSIDMIEF